jgi:hypothetical protein
MKNIYTLKILNYYGIKSKSTGIVFADIEIIVEAIVILIDDTHAAIGRRNFQDLQQMPFGAAKL